MSRVGKIPLTIPSGVNVTPENTQVLIKGPKGEVSIGLKAGINVEVRENSVYITRKQDIKSLKALHGTVRNLIANAIKGVTEGWQKNLELLGTGYRVKQEGNDLQFSLGYSHPIQFKSVPGIEYSVDGQNKISIRGLDRQLVGLISAKIRGLRPPEPYKGKGIRYEGEIIRLKAGKAAKGETK